MERNGSCRLVWTENLGNSISEAELACRGPLVTGATRRPDESDPCGEFSRSSEATADGSPACRQERGALGQSLLAHVIRFQVHAGAWVSRRIRMLDGPALRAGNDSSRCRPTVFRTVSCSPGFRAVAVISAFRMDPGGFQSPSPVMIGLPAFKLSNSVGILLPLRLLAYWPGRRQTAEHAGI